VNIDVNDLATAVTFYCSAFELTVGRRFGADGVELLGASSSIYLRAVAAGARLERPIQTSKWGRLALLADPFGHGFCLVQFLGRGYDEIAQDRGAPHVEGA